MYFLRRLGFYISAGIFSALVGWSVSQIIWIDLISFLRWFLQIFGLGSTKFTLPSLLILTVITPCMAIAMVAMEIFISNPTRYKANWRILWPTYLRAVIITGIISGTLLSLLNWQLLVSNWSSIHVRLLSWGLIGLFVGLAESVSWSFRSIEGSGSKARNRILQSTILGIFAGLLAATIYSNIRQYFGEYQEPVGFALLGILLGGCLSFTSRPSYQVALRAGYGFESVPTNSGLFSQINCKRFSHKVFGFVPIPEGKNNNQIEEGLSIKLPTSASVKKPIIIGSNHDADIFIPGIPEKCLSLWFESNGVNIKCEHEKAVEIQQKKLSEGDTTTLRHNQILTLYHKTNSEEFYRFIFYDRFLDPQA
ncbi:MAG: hypothetical protein RMZ41_002810 [Nostoc sp. DedVER02]|uniref:hypothetical protein n=1 Tax=unclassified Nostoc TaxID=2593658 RepID=UPI002AD391E3|nr:MULTISPECIES: hypothetical protein [unclassified Nostoc]MDZ7986910.1 hypothetical protein [Nostoc sp. DedVER02]MDZ8115812.1 hypothetical protein [Nostoc sp. DedVER01b]